MAEDERPEAVLMSPYVRAMQTATLIRDAGGLAGDLPLCSDERLREKEFGILDGLTSSGVASLFPDQAKFRRTLGKFYHRPPEGESWTDVILRLRSVLDTVSLHHAGQRVLIVAHQVVVLCLRYILETLDEEAILEIDRSGDVANCSVIEYRFDPHAGTSGKLVLARYNYTVPVADEAVPVTVAKDTPARDARMIAIDAAWCADHPLPPFGAGLDKETRGTVLVVGGSALVPGAPLLTGEAALRVGAGKVQLAVIQTIVAAAAVAFPESALIALPVDAGGEIIAAGAGLLERCADACDVLVVGPGMSGSAETPALLETLLDAIGDRTTIVVDAGAMAALG